MTALNTNYKYRDTLSYWENNYDTIWRITNDFKAIPKYFINIGEKKIPIENATSKNVFNFKYFSKFDKITELYETKNHLFIRAFFNKKLNDIYYDKKMNISKSVKFSKPFGKGSHFSFYNDIDGGLPFWPMGNVSDNKLFMLVFGYEMRDYIARKGKDFDALDKNGREKLLKLVEKSKISDNPILMVVTLKE